MALHSLELTPSAVDGWSFGPIEFGEVLTAFIGANGAGKTPIMKAIRFGLGTPVEFPTPMSERFRSVVLKFRNGDREYRIERELANPSEARTKESGQEEHLVVGESAITAWVLDRLGISARRFMGLNDQVVPPYMSVIAPAFMIDQDSGWQLVYSALDRYKFIKDQSEEIARWMLGIDAKNLLVSKADLQRAKNNRDSLRERIAVKRQAYEALAGEVLVDRAPEARARLEARYQELQSQYRDSFQVVESLRTAETDADREVQSARIEQKDLEYELRNLRLRRDYLAEIEREIDAELQSLGENEIAADIFRTMCGSSTCHFFRRPNASYGRRLLYLRDQMKDFDTNKSQINLEIESIGSRLREATTRLAVAGKRVQEVMRQAGATVALDMLKERSAEMSKLVDRTTRLAQVDRLQSELDSMIVDENKATEEVERLTPRRGGRREDLRLFDVRLALQHSFESWLQTLQTPNVVGKPDFDDSLNPVVSGSAMKSGSQHSGSTRVRIVLAFHAAVLETSLALSGNHPRLLLLDAPLQHELAVEDLSAYVKRLCQLSMTGREVQIVISAAREEVVPADVNAVKVKPQFVMGNEQKFFGVAASDDSSKLEAISE